MIIRTITFDVPGTAHPQGSKRHVGGGRMIEASPYVKAWRASVTSHAIAKIIQTERQTGHIFPYTGPVHLKVVFHLPRPKHHYRTGKFAGTLRAVAPRLMQTGPDLDKMVRAVGDALTLACLIVDDKQIYRIDALKAWTTGDPYTAITVNGHDQWDTAKPNTTA